MLRRKPASCAVIVLLVIQVCGAANASGEEPERQGSPFSRFMIDLAVVGGFTGTTILVNPPLRKALQEESTLNNIQENFASPVARVREGTRRDTDSFAVNYIAHPGSYLAMGAYLKQRGYRDSRALIFTQAHSVVWEFCIEGSSFPPSGKDLISNAAGSVVAIYVLHPVSQKAETRIKSHKAKWFHHLLYWLDPVNALNDRFNR